MDQPQIGAAAEEAAELDVLAVDLDPVGKAPAEPGAGPGRHEKQETEPLAVGDGDDTSEEDDRRKERCHDSSMPWPR